MTTVQARIPVAIAHQADQDAAVLGLGSRSAAVREGLRLLHRQARQTGLAREYDDFYVNSRAPVSEIAAIGDAVAAETIADRQRSR